MLRGAAHGAVQHQIGEDSALACGRTTTDTAETASHDYIARQAFRPADCRTGTHILGWRLLSGIDEAWRIYDGGVGNPNNYNKINSPGYKFIKHLLGEG
jgi:hypothetical protein